MDNNRICNWDRMVMLKPIAYFVIGVFTGLTISGLIKQGKPVDRIVIHDNYRLRYNYPSRYPYGYDYYYRPIEYRGGHGQSNTRNDEGRRGGGGRKDTESGETHTNVRQVQDKVKN